MEEKRRRKRVCVCVCVHTCVCERERERECIAPAHPRARICVCERGREIERDGVPKGLKVWNIVHHATFVLKQFHGVFIYNIMLIKWNFI